MTSPSILVGELAAEVAASAFERHDIKPLLTKGSRVYRQISLGISGAQFCLHLSVGNFSSAAMIFVTKAGEEIASRYLAEAGGLLAQISKADGGYELTGDFLGAYTELPYLNIISLGKLKLEEQERAGEEVLRASAKAAELARLADSQARTAASRLSKLIIDADGTLDGIQMWIPALSGYVKRLRPNERLGVRKSRDGCYSGSFVNDKREGFGVFSSEIGTYSGTWQDDRPFGYGVWKVRGRGAFAGDFGRKRRSGSAVGLSKRADGLLHLGEHAQPSWGALESGNLSERDFQPDGFGSRGGIRELERGLWQGQERTLELKTKLQIREQVLDEVDASRLPGLMVWKAQQKVEIAEERLKVVIAEHDIRTALREFDTGSERMA